MHRGPTPRAAAPVGWVTSGWVVVTDPSATQGVLAALASMPGASHGDPREGYVPVALTAPARATARALRERLLGIPGVLGADPVSVAHGDAGAPPDPTTSMEASP